jgi:hypothetical protein
LGTSGSLWESGSLGVPWELLGVPEHLLEQNGISATENSCRFRSARKILGDENSRCFRRARRILGDEKSLRFRRARRILDDGEFSAGL